MEWSAYCRHLGSMNKRAARNNTLDQKCKYGSSLEFSIMVAMGAPRTKNTVRLEFARNPKPLNPKP